MTTTSKKSQSRSNVQDANQNEIETALNGTGYTITISKTASSPIGSQEFPQDSAVYYRVQSDDPELLLKTDNLVNCIKREFNISDFDRYEGESYEILIESATVPDGVSTARKVTSNEINCTVLKSDSVELSDVIEEFVSKATSQLSSTHG